MEFSAFGEPDSRRYLLRLDPGERLVESLLRFSKEQDIRGAAFRGLGAVRDAELGWFDLETKTYRSRTFSENLELLSLEGNVARSEGEPAVHVHAVCGRKDLGCVGGHLVEALCTVTVEVWMAESGFPLERVPDERFGLRLLRFPPP
jgi:predicted DNA-binding protein with PD1-like motif